MIVEHGKSGFVWNTLDELKKYTELLAGDEALWKQMSAAARERARGFARDRFIEKMSRMCGVRIAPQVAPKTVQYAT